MVEEKGRGREGRICFPKQILMPPAARMHWHSGQMRHAPLFPFPFLLQFLSEVSGHYARGHCPVRRRAFLVIRVPYTKYHIFFKNLLTYITVSDKVTVITETKKDTYFRRVL